MCDQHVAARQILGLRQWAEDSLEQGSVGAELRTDETETGQLSREMRSAWIQGRQGFPVVRIVDDTLGVLACPFGVPSPLILHAPIPGTKRRGRRDLHQVEV